MLKARPLIFWLISAGVVSFLVSLVVAAPFAEASGQNQLAQGIYGAFAMLCHQLPDRSYFIDGHKFAVCTRCTGLYAGFAVTMLLYPLISSLKRTSTPPRSWILLAAIPLVVDFSITFFGFWENTHTSRMLTGALLGGAAVFYVMPGIVELSLRRVRAAQSTQPRVTFTLASPDRIAAAPSDYSAPERRI